MLEQFPVGSSVFACAFPRAVNDGGQQTQWAAGGAVVTNLDLSGQALWLSKCKMQTQYWLWGLAATVNRWVAAFFVSLVILFLGDVINPPSRVSFSAGVIPPLHLQVNMCICNVTYI